MAIKNSYDLEKAVDRAVDNVKVTDVHTHLFTTDFGDLLLWGIDELITYHYLVAETMRYVSLSYDEFWALSKIRQADLIWETLFIKNSPYSEACRGVLTVLEKLGLDVGSRDLDEYREYFKNFTVDDYIDKVFDVAGIKDVVMTNDPFQSSEKVVWLDNYKGDERFKSALRIDQLLNNWEDVYTNLKEWGYKVEIELTEHTIKEIQRFLNEWIDKMNPLYMAASLPPDFRVPEDSARATIVEKCIIPVSRERNVPFAMMIGAKKLTNPNLIDAGDSVGKSDINTVEYLCAKYPQNKFLLTMLSKENQHELCVAARKFRNLLIFGCWWFLNNPSIIEEMTRMRFELLGVSVIPQHSDARVLDQLIYKWSHSRKIIADILYDKYNDILSTGWYIKEEEIIRDVEKLFGGNLWEFIEKKL